MAKKEDKKYKDYIDDFDMPIIKFLDAKQTLLAEEHFEIIKALRINKHMTAKEIHELYIDKDTKKHQYTIKTIYRYLEKLEGHDFVQISGHRITKKEGKRLTEQLYTRTANIYFKAKKEEVYPDLAEKRRDSYKKLYTVLQEIDDTPLISFEEFEKLLIEKFDSEQEFNRKVVEIISENKVLTDLYTEMDIDIVNHINDLASMLLVFAKKPEIIKKLQNIYKKK